MSTTTFTDWKERAVAVYQARQAQLQAEDEARHTRLIQELGDALRAFGIPADPNDYPATVDGVTFRLFDNEYEQVLQVRRVCVVCGAEQWESFQSAFDLGRALVEPWECWFGHHQQSQELPKASDPATVLVEALRAFIAAEREARDA